MASILVIDDVIELRTTLELSLLDAGHAVTPVTNGREALEALTKQKFDLVLTDVLMPQKDGLEVLMELRKSNPTLPVIVMTGGGTLPPAYYLKLARDLGARAVLQKPFSNEQLTDAVAAALAQPK